MERCSLQMTGLSDTWTTTAHRGRWDNLFNERVRNSRLSALPNLQCTVCSRTFHREQGISVLKRDWSQCANNGVHYSVLFVRGGLGVTVVLLCISTCTTHNPAEHVQVLAVDNRLHCFLCERSFNWSSDLKWHKCLAERSLPIELQHEAIQCPIWFHSKGVIAVHKCQPAEGMSWASL